LSHHAIGNAGVLHSPGGRWVQSGQRFARTDSKQAARLELSEEVSNATKIFAIFGALAISPAMVSSATLKDTTTPHAEDTLLPGAKVTAYGTGVSELSGSGIKVECNDSLLTGEVDKNNGTEF